MNRSKADIPGSLVVLLIVGIMLLWGLAFIAGGSVERRTQPVCHSITEDSVITDCDYQNGAWYRK